MLMMAMMKRVDLTGKRHHDHVGVHGGAAADDDDADDGDDHDGDREDIHE